ncbi:response regulator receiver domain [Parasphingopyxis marina]|uniref:Response receiver domain-containing protein n=1 Tax=Parasphingopyxis marina TaxID=2761622 RepID=A0A842HVK1_9SPHN|nr:response regulator receiver domain [Parasphingopyxis marina]MBC2777126.1 hypothetical protein [Parasphingopyxis marina]
MNDTYASFIEKAFIDPIRSVLIVDDQYPTIDGTLAAAINKEWHQEDWEHHAKDVELVISEFRGAGRPYLLDIHDPSLISGKDADQRPKLATEVSKEQEPDVAEHLHQTDLLILDYNLEPGNDEDGSLAISIARSILKNAHFNLCVIHTNKELDEVFPEVLIGLLHPDPDFADPETLLDANRRFENSDKYDPGRDPGVGPALKALVSKEIYFRARSEGLDPFVIDGGAGARFVQILRDYGVSEEDWRTFVAGAFDDFQNDETNGLSDTDLRIAAWNEGRNGSPPWIRSDFGFLAFTKKKEGPLLKTLREALSSWGPRPSRLLATMVRAEIDEHGIEVQDRMLGDSYAAANWYLRLVKDKTSARSFLIDETVRRHTEQLLAEILPRVSKFMNELIEADEATLEDEGKLAGADAVEPVPIKSGAYLRLVDKRFGIDLSINEKMDRAIRDHNVFVCSMPVTGWHLQTGHVLKINDAYWCCLSPICDLVPGQGKNDAPDSFDGWKRFTAVWMDEVEMATALKKVNSNRYVFLRTRSGEQEPYQAFKIVDGSSDNPVWSTFYADDDGRLFWPEERSQSPLPLSIRRLERKLPKKDSESGNFEFAVREATVVAQLRYEYALNLLQTLGGSITRIGLDFQKKS